MSTPSAKFQTLSQHAGHRADDRLAGRMVVEGLTSSQGRVLDMSVTGMRVVRSTRWRPGEIRRLSLPVLAGRTMALPAVCRWCEKIGFFKYLCGIEFLDLTPEHREALRHVALTNAKRGWLGVDKRDEKKH